MIGTSTVSEFARESIRKFLGYAGKEAWLFYRTSSGVRLCWELEEPKGPKGPVQVCHQWLQDSEADENPSTSLIIASFGLQRETGCGEGHQFV